MLRPRLSNNNNNSIIFRRPAGEYYYGTSGTERRARRRGRHDSHTNAAAAMTHWQHLRAPVRSAAAYSVVWFFFHFPSSPTHPRDAFLASRSSARPPAYPSVVARALPTHLRRFFAGNAARTPDSRPVFSDTADVRHSGVRPVGARSPRPASTSTSRRFVGHIAQTPRARGAFSGTRVHDDDGRGGGDERCLFVSTSPPATRTPAITCYAVSATDFPQRPPVNCSPLHYVHLSYIHCMCAQFECYNYSEAAGYRVYVKRSKYA